MTKNTNIRNILKQVSVTIREVFQFSYNMYNNNSLHNYQNSYNQITGKIKHYNLLKNTTDIFNHISIIVIIGIRKTTFETKEINWQLRKQMKADQQTRPKLIPFYPGKFNPSKSFMVHVSQPRFRNPLIMTTRIHVTWIWPFLVPSAIKWYCQTWWKNQNYPISPVTALKWNCKKIDKEDLT